MRLMAEVLANRIAKEFDETYLMFLKDEKVRDTPVVKLGFAEAAIKMITAEPIPDPTTQILVLQYFQRMKKDAYEHNDDLLGAVKFTYLQVSGKAEDARRQETEEIRAALAGGSKGDSACDV